MGWLASASVVLGVIGLVVLFNPPITSCGNPLVGLYLPFAGLGGLCALIALRYGKARRRAGVGLALSIAGPGLLVLQLPRTHPPRPESNAIGDVRKVILAESAYRAVGGYYDTLECLAAPKDCLPNYPVNGPTFLEPKLTSLSTRCGYRRSFHNGPVATEAPSTTALQSFAYVAVPTIPNRTGVRGFCGDSTGIICTTSGAQPRVDRGLCDVSPGSACQPLR